MEVFLQNIWQNTGRTGALLLLAAIFSFWKSPSLSYDEFFSQQRWSVGKAITYLIIIDLLLILFNSLLELSRNLLAMAIGWLFIGPFELFVVWLIFYFDIRQPLTKLGLSKDRSVALVFVGLKWMLSFQVAIHLFVLILPSELIFGVLERKRETVLPLGMEFYRKFFGSLGFFVYYFWFFIFTSITQEITDRGLFYGALRRKVGPGLSMVISASVFMLGHNGFALFALGFGCFAAYLYERYHSLLPGIAAHIGFNLSYVTFQWIIRSTAFDPKTYFLGATVVFSLGFLIVHLALLFCAPDSIFHKKSGPWDRSNSGQKRRGDHDREKA